MDDLPRCVLTNILSRLPGTSILRCRSVSKSWLETIDDASFRGILNPRETMILGVRGGNWEHAPSIYRITSRGSGTDVAMIQMCDSIELFDYRFKNSCRGFLYFENFSVRKNRRSMVVNPFTRKVVHVPDNPGRIYNYSVKRALAFDDSTCTFKLIELSSEFYTGDGLGAACYNFKTRRWTPCEAPQCPSHVLRSSQILASSETGTLYWITSNDRSDGITFGPLILSFDAVKEEFSFIGFPHPFISMHMIELNGRLTLLHPVSTSRPTRKYINVYELVDLGIHRWEVAYCISCPFSDAVSGLCTYSSKEILASTSVWEWKRDGSWQKKLFYLYDMESMEWKNLGECRFNKRHGMRVDCVKLNLTPLEDSVRI